MAAVVAQSKSAASSRLSHGGSLARRGFLLISTLQLRPWHLRVSACPLPTADTHFATTQAGTSGKLQSKRIFNAVDMLVQIADRLQVDYRRLGIVKYFYFFNGCVEVHPHKVFSAVAV